MSDEKPRGFIGALSAHRRAIQALRICYRRLEDRVRRLEAFRAVAEPLLVDKLLTRVARRRRPRT